MNMHSGSHRAHKQHYRAHETAREDDLDGLPLAVFWQRMLGYWVDLTLAVLLWFPIEGGWRWYVWHQRDFHMAFDFHEKGNVIVLLLYFGLANYVGNGQTPGKWVARTRAISLTHERMTLWQSIERALGYGAAVLEGGLGFAQYFWSHNRQCAQDRLAETIVVDVREKAKRLRG